MAQTIHPAQNPTSGLRSAMTMWGKLSSIRVCRKQGQHLRHFNNACCYSGSSRNKLVTGVVPSISSTYKPLMKMSSHEGSKFNCIITGAGGFVGQALASALLADPLISKLTLTDVFKPDVPQTKSPSGVEIRCLDADLTSLETCQSLFTPDINLIYLLHGIMSGAA